MNQSTSGGIYLTGWLVIMAVFGLLGSAIGKGKGRGTLGFVLGAFLGIFGLIIISLMGASDFPAYQARGPARLGSRGRGLHRPVRRRRPGPQSPRVR